MTRHPEISERVTETVNANRAKVSESSMRALFGEVQEYLTAEGLLSIESNRIFNCDETGNKKSWNEFFQCKSLCTRMK